MNWQQLISDYANWIKDNTKVRSIGNGDIGAFSTPFTDRHNDHIEIYIKKVSDNDFILTDDGQTIEDLEMTGVEFDTPKRQKIFEIMLNGLGVKSERGEIYVEANATNLPQKKHYLIQAILSVNDMYVLSRDNVYSLFKEDIERFFAANNVFYTKDIKLTGRSGFDHNMDFVISASHTKPERLIKAINMPRKDPVAAAIFTFNDIAAVRSQNTKNFVIYNDTENVPSGDVLSALTRYDIEGVPWSRKEEAIEKFALV